jgi:hypothetical protein
MSDKAEFKQRFFQTQIVPFSTPHNLTLPLRVVNYVAYTTRRWKQSTSIADQSTLYPTYLCHSGKPVDFLLSDGVESLN